MKQLLDQFINELTFITGISKNVGKTTFLNYAAKYLRELTPIVLTSIGIDGESRDLVFGNQKPQVLVETGDFILTAELAIKSSQAVFRILEVFPGKTVFGKMVFAEVLRGDTIELIGPETNSQMGAMLSTIRNSYHKKTILVDGAANRVTQVASGIDSHCGVIDIIKVTPDNLPKTLERLSIIDWVRKNSQISASDFINQQKNSKTYKEEEFYSLEGALTETKLKLISTSVKYLVLDDYSCLFINPLLLDKLNLKVYFKNTIRLRGAVAILYDIEETLFWDQIKALGYKDFIYNNPYKGPIL